MTTATTTPMDRWETLPWRMIQRNVFKVQKRIYQAAQRGDVTTVRKFQRLLMSSRSAKLLAVRKVTQDNRGKGTAGVDGVKALTPPQRLKLAHALRVGRKARPVRRVWIPKPETDEQRPLGIPTIHDRALQTLVKLALEPEWEARFEANSYGFRPGRSCHDAIEAIFNATAHLEKYVLDADVAKCFDRINHDALLDKLNTGPKLRRQINAWLKAGVLDEGELFPTERGTMQGGTISPLLANVALHGMEELLVQRFPTKLHKGFYAPQVIRYADDLVVLHKDRAIIQQCQEVLAEWLQHMGLELKPSKTRITHTRNAPVGEPGFSFLGFNIRQYAVGKTQSGKDTRRQRVGFKLFIKPSKSSIKRHIHQLGVTVGRHQHKEQTRLIRALNSLIIGWCRYYSTVVSQDVFEKVEYVFFARLFAWAKRRHPNKSKWWIVDQYWRITKGKGWRFQPPGSDYQLYQHRSTPIRRHVKVQGRRSPYDGDWLYWSTRLGKHPEVPLRVTRLLKRQRGKCPACELFFKDGDVMEVVHTVSKQPDGNGVRHYRHLLHRHCQQAKSASNKLLA
jgi:RNA-directed DNA polymerase